MRHRGRTGWYILALALALTACSSSPPTPGPGTGPTPGPPVPTPGGDPVVLFDGRPPSSWSQAGPGHFDLTDGSLLSQGGIGLLWYSAATFDNFVLELDWRLTRPADNSGVFVRFPDPGGDPGVAINNGYEIQINDNPAGDPQKTGAIYGVQPAVSRASRPVGEWNHYTIQVIDAAYTVWLNGVFVNQFTSTDAARPRRGHIGLQNHDPGSAVYFRNIRLHLV